MARKSPKRIGRSNLKKSPLNIRKQLARYKARKGERKIKGKRREGAVASVNCEDEKFAVLGG